MELKIYPKLDINQHQFDNYEMDYIHKLDNLSIEEYLSILVR
jgi:2-iminoacetate synthase ThiH